MTTTPRARWPRKPPTPALGELHTAAGELPALAGMSHVERYRTAAELLATLPRILRAVRDEAAVAALKDGMTYRTLAAAVGKHVGTINKRVTNHYARTRTGTP